MSLAIEVSLLSGRVVSLEARPDESVESLKARALESLAVHRGRLVDPSGRVLHGAATIHESRLQSGDTLTLQIGRTQVCGTLYSFAGILGDGSVVTWGGAGGAGEDLQQRLKDAQGIQATSSASQGDAFAAILGDGSVATWGSTHTGGNSSALVVE